MATYACTPAACRADAASGHEAFRALQTVINRFADAAAFTPIAVDGVLTEQTLTAATAVAVLFGLMPPGSLAALAAQADAWSTALAAELINPEAVDDAAPLAIETVGVIEQLAQSCRRNAAGPACTQARALCQRARANQLDQLPELRGLCAAPNLTRARWLVAGVLAIAALGTGYVIWRRRRTRTRQRGPKRVNRY